MKTSKILEILKKDREGIIIKFDNTNFKLDDLIVNYVKKDCCLENRQRFNVMIYDKDNNLYKLLPYNTNGSFIPDCSNLIIGNDFIKVDSLKRETEKNINLLQEVEILKTEISESGIQKTKIKITK